MIQDHPYITLAVIIFIILRLKYVLDRTEYAIDVQYHYEQHIENFVFSTREFYEILQETIESKNIPTYIEWVSIPEGGLLSRKRLYLKVYNNITIYLFSAIRVGQDFFINYRQGIAVSDSGSEKGETYYQHDSEKAYRQSIHKCLLQSIEIMTKHYGYRTPIS